MYSDFYNLQQPLSKNWLLKSIRMVLNFFLILFQIFLVYLTHKKNIILRNKDVLNTAPTYWINKKKKILIIFCWKSSHRKKLSHVYHVYIWILVWFFRCILYCLHCVIPIADILPLWFTILIQSDLTKIVWKADELHTLITWSFFMHIMHAKLSCSNIKLKLIDW